MTDRSDSADRADRADKPTRPSIEEVEAQIAERTMRASRAQLGAYAQHAKHDAHETTRGAFQARMRRYREQADPTGELAARDPQELARRAEAALNADMARVRLARTTKKAHAKRKTAEEQAQARAAHAAMRDAIAARLLLTPSDDIVQLAAFTMALQAIDAS